MFDYELLEPTTLPEVLDVLNQHGEEAQLIAGGAFLTIALKLGLVGARYLVSLQRIPELHRLQFDPEAGLTLGAMVTHRAVETSPLVQEHYPLLAQTYAKVANVRVRNQATVGGNLVAADYASDPQAALIALQAGVHLLSVRGERRLPVRDFITGHYQTRRRPDELLMRVTVPPPAPGARAVYLKFKTRSSEDRPCVSVAACLRLDDAGDCQDLRVVVGAAAETPQTFDEVTDVARGRRLGQPLIDQIAARYASRIESIDDLRGSAWYRRQVTEVLVRRALRALAA